MADDDRAGRHRSDASSRAAEIQAVGPGAGDDLVASGPGDTVTSRQGTLSGGLWNAAATLLPMVSTLALSIVISRQLGAAVLGEQSVIAYINSLLVSVLIYSFTTASIQLLAAAGGARDDDRLAWLSRWAAGAHLGGGILGAVVLACIGLARDDYRSLWFLAAATALVDALGWSRTVRDIAAHGWTRTSRRRLVAQAASPLLAIAAIYAGFGIQGVFAAQLVVAVVLLAVLVRLDRGMPHLPRRSAGRPDWRPALRVWSMFTASLLISQIIQRRVELVFLDQFHDGPTVAMFSVAVNLVTIPITATGTLIGASLPAIAARYAQDPEAVTAAQGRAARVICTIGVVLAAGTISVGPGLVESAYGAEFTQAAGLVRYLGLMLLVVPLGQICTALWTGTGRLAPVLWSGGIAATVDLVLSLVLIPPFALTGAVIATFSAQTVGAVLIVAYTTRNGISLRLRPVRLLIAATVSLAAGLAAAGTRLVVDGLLGDLTAGVVFLAVVALGLRVVGLFDRPDLEWLAGFLPGPAGRLLRAMSR